MAATAELLRTFGLEGLAKIAIGWNPVTRSVPAIPAAIIIFISGFVIGQILSNISKQLLSGPIRDYVLEFLKTLTLCIYPFGFGIIRKYYGETGFILCAIPVISITLLTLPGADGNLIVVWLRYFSKTITLRYCLIKTALQILAGLAAIRIGMLIMRLELHPVYLARLKSDSEGACASALQVPLHVGLMAEMLGVVHVTWISSQKLAAIPVVDTFIKVSNLVLILSAGSGFTGMFLNPANATGHTFGCGATSRPTHVLVYWAGPLIGTWLSVQLQGRFSINGREKSQSSVPKTDARRKKIE